MRVRAGWIASVVMTSISCEAPEPRKQPSPVVRRALPDIVRVEGGPFRGRRLPCGGARESVSDVVLEVGAFAIDRKLVTCAAYADCVEAGVCQPLLRNTRQETYARGCDEGLAAVERPDAQQYCVFVGGRLPSSLEWQRAIRGAAGLEYPEGHSKAESIRNCKRRTSRDPQRPRCSFESPDGVVHVLESFVPREHLGDEDCRLVEDRLPDRPPRAYAAIDEGWLGNFAISDTPDASMFGYFRCVYPTR